MILFSIITVCYNSKKTLARTMESVLKQNFKEYEYIIVDGGSEDGTIDIIKQYEPLFEGRLLWKSEHDKGIYDAFNKGIARSRGTYVWIVNSDDFLQPDALNFLSGEIKKYKNGSEPIISCALNYIEDSTGKTLNKIFYSAEDARKYYNNDSTGVVHPATLVPKRIYEQFGVFDDRYKLSGDNDWFHRVYEKGQPFIFQDYIITNMSNAGISSQWTWKRYKISKADRYLYYNKFYRNPIIRYIKYLIWNILMLSIIVKTKCRK